MEEAEVRQQVDALVGVRDLGVRTLSGKGICFQLPARRGAAARRRLGNCWVSHWKNVLQYILSFVPTWEMAPCTFSPCGERQFSETFPIS